MRVAIAGRNPPGRVICRPDGSSMDNVDVGVQLGRDPAQLVRADQADPLWEVDVDLDRSGGRLDFRGPAVHGKRGDRFIYLTWGNLSLDNVFEMFRRAKLMFDGVEPHLIDATIEAGCLRAEWISRVAMAAPDALGSTRPLWRSQFRWPDRPSLLPPKPLAARRALGYELQQVSR